LLAASTITLSAFFGAEKLSFVVMISAPIFSTTLIVKFLCPMFVGDFTNNFHKFSCGTNKAKIRSVKFLCRRALSAVIAS
jgi:hypothetical protein